MTDDDTTPSPHRLDVVRCGTLLRTGRLTSRALTLHTLARIERLNPVLHAFVRVTARRALADAERADRELASGVDRGPLHGIPYALKDIFDTEGIPTTSHSHLMLDHVPAADCGIEERLRAGGAVLVGKLATHEFALGGPSWELPFPPARNPWNLEHFTGASSSGSGAAVAAGLVRVAFGSDTSGSIRGPACHCGVVGLKPTYGLVSRRGAFPLSYTLDHCGPLGWTVADVASALQVIAGHDERDPSSRRVAIPDYLAGLSNGIEGTRVAYARDLFATDPVTSPEVVRGLDAAVRTLRELGAEVRTVTLPPFDVFNACGRVIMTAEAFAVHEPELRRRPSCYGRYTFQRIAPGAGLTAADLVQAYRVRKELFDAVEQAAFDWADVLVTATGVTQAARFDDFPPDWPPPKAAAAMLTIPFNVTGHPSLAMPIGLFGSGLPMGLQLVGRAFDEVTVLRVGAALERALEPARGRPRYS
ncbi:amidase [Streptosporangium sp. NPDC049376]|uniref:amidase n=1 Tax=Streptosporangium sp. NPDC049376 TaxID=3366192 RepID=UPI0037ABD13F